MKHDHVHVKHMYISKSPIQPNSYNMYRSDDENKFYLFKRDKCNIL